MAIYHVHAQVISRGDQRSAVAAAAYRHRCKMALSNDVELRQFDYTEKSGDLAHEEIALPDQVPQWLKRVVDGNTVAGASEALWNAVETHEKRSNAQLAREFVIALPTELSKDSNIALARDYVREAFTSKGMVADWVLHNKPDNPHIHVMVTMSPLAEQGFGSRWETLLDAQGKPVRRGGKIQYRQWAGDKEMVKAWRALWADVANAHLQRAGVDVRIDHRSYEAQGIALEPTTKIGVNAANIKRSADAKGQAVDLERLQNFEDVRRTNAARILRRPEIVLAAIAKEKSVFDARDIAKYLHRYVDDLTLFQNLMAKIVGHPDLVKLQAEGLDPETGTLLPAKFSTRALIRIEAEMARRADHLVSDRRHGVDANIRNRILAAHDRLSDEQRVAIERMTNQERLAVVVGRAGAGKTTMMNAAREVWEACGYRVVGGALAGKAAEGLEKEAGIASRTLASWQLALSRGKDVIDDKTVFIMDEAGMVASRQMADFIELVSRAGAKLVLVGDADQLQPIEAGAAFRSIADRVGYAELGTIYRQHTQWMRDASMDLARGDVAKAMNAYQANGHLVRTRYKDEAIERMIADWSRDYDPSKSTVMLAHLRDDVRRLNRMARDTLVQRGVIEPGHAFRSEDGERSFAKGDQIVFLNNDRDLGVKNGMMGRVVEADKGKVVVEIGDPGSDQQKRVSVVQRHYRNIDHGYATTVHKSQGATVDQVKVLGSLSLDRHLTYVAMTRHREDVKFYYGGLSFEKNGGLIENLSKKGAKETTLDYAGLDHGGHNYAGMDHAGSELYRQAVHYAHHRGLYGLRVAKALIDNQYRWLVEQKARLQRLGSKLATVGERLGFMRMSVGTSIDPSVSAVTNTTLPQQPWFKGIETFAKTVQQAVEDKLQSDKVLVLHWTELRERVALIYQNPDQAMRAMKLDQLVTGDHQANRSAADQLAKQIGQNPEQFGSLRGKVGLLAGKAAKQERHTALANIQPFGKELIDYVRLRNDASQRLTMEIERERNLLLIDIPALSPRAEATLERIRDAIDRNDVNAGLAFALNDKMVEQELAEVAVALNKRFGERAFTGSKTPDAATFNAVSSKVSEGERVNLAKIWPKLNAIQRVAAHKHRQEQQQVMAQQQAQNKEQNKGQSKDQSMTR
ncbi:MAG TPA: Ti-type conjugative transfer relaxase TraA [Rhizobium sp.]|nr:Ti-type conjugative transfer relaxase TraA [Rhizobium sp.]